ncbi:uncharacterized protein LOC144750046 isoform X1 [Ciona intestinalis]
MHTATLQHHYQRLAPSQMDSSDNFFWNAEVANGNDNGILHSSIDGFIQQQQIIIQDQDSPPPKSSPLISTETTSQSITFSQQSHVTMAQEEKPKETTVTVATDGILPMGIVNPDAIEPKPRSYTCRICQITFPNKSEVTVHSRLHTDHQGKPYRCNFCGKGFSTNFYLKQHERIHSGQKPYKCPMCENSFKQLSHVQQHVRTHTGVRPYKCHWPGCGKAFLQQSHLKSHEARHEPKPTTGARPFKCHWPDCGKSFAQLTNLKSHVARHTPGKSKGKKGNAKKAGSGNSEDNVINQAAAAANIVPGMGITVNEEAEIRPFLCPGCSKLYVREATFKKHLEECKTKLQLSISATASALGIAPPPMPSSSGGMQDFDQNLLQVNIVGTQNQQPAKRARISHDEQQIGIQGQTMTDGDTIQVKQETVIEENTVFVTREDGEYKLPDVLYSTNQGDQISIEDVTFHQTSSSEHPTSSSQIIAHSSAPGIILSQPTNTSASGKDPGTSTINQAALRWQWDSGNASIPRLNFP